MSNLATNRLTNLLNIQNELIKVFDYSGWSSPHTLRLIPLVLNRLVLARALLEKLNIDQLSQDNIKKVIAELLEQNLPDFSLSHIEDIWDKLPTSLISELFNQIHIPDFSRNEFSFLGQCYEELMSYLNTRKKLGMYYTPSLVIQFLISQFVLPYCESLDRKRVNILDPSCGDGNFLQQVLSLLVNRQPSDSLSDFDIRLYGVDIDPIAIDIAQSNFYLLSLSSDHLKREPFVQLRRGDLLCFPENSNDFISAHEDFFRNLITRTDQGIIKQKSHYVQMFKKQTKTLFGSDIAEDSFFWFLEFPEVLFDSNERFKRTGFDIIIGNPPYLSYFSNDPRYLSAERRKYYAQRYVSVPHEKSRINVMNLFIERAFSLLRPGGLLVFVINKTFLELPSFLNIRQFVVNHFLVEAIIPELSIFDAIVDTCVIVLKKPIKPIKLLNLKEQFIKWIDPSSILRSELTIFLKTSQSQIPSNNYYSFLPLSESDLKVLDQISDNCLPLSEFCTVNRGMNIGGFSEYFLADEAKTSNHHQFIQSLSQISPFKIKEIHKYVLFDKKLERHLREEKGATIALGSEKRFKEPNILVAEAGSRITAVLNTQGLYASYSFHVITLKSEGSYPLMFLLALLNSSVLSYFAIKKRFIRKGRKATPHLGTLGLRQLPVPKNPQTSPFFKQIVTLTCEILELSHLKLSNSEIFTQKKQILDELCYDVYGVKKYKNYIDGLFSSKIKY
ncbi:MAG: Eco57I restriction-modification methylase domain-containing protein [Candidatus Hermodarchaeota archaeon]